MLRKIFENRTNASQNDGAKRISTNDLASFLWSLCKNSISSKKYCFEFAERVDVDKDGNIDDMDIQTYMSRTEYIEESDKELRTKTQLFASTNNLFPKTTLSEDRIELILRDIRTALNNKKISFHDFIKLIDVNEVGFITINDLSVGLDKILKLSQPAKDGLFAYADKLKIGMINYQDFIALLKRVGTERKVVN